MRDEPDELTAERVAECLQTHWGIRLAELSYAPVGHGSYHWIGADRSGPRWFVTADRLTRAVEYLPGTVDQSFATLAAAADTARQLADSGHEYVLAPLPDRAGTLVQRVLPAWALQLFPYVQGRSTDQGSWNDPAEQAEVARLVGRLHAATPPSTVPQWDFAIPGREALESALDDVDRPWTGGAYGEIARAFLTESQTSIHALLRRYDDLVREIEADADPWVVTHGEPDSDNVIRADDGRLYLIDWGPPSAPRANATWSRSSTASPTYSRPIRRRPGHDRHGRQALSCSPSGGACSKPLERFSSSTAPVPATPPPSLTGNASENR